MPAAGSLLGGYRIERVLGSGGMGTVYLAHSPDLPRLDALKVLSSAYSTNPEFRARFLREADVAAALAHPNIVAIHRRGETSDGQLWIAMQFVDGTDADAALRAGSMTAQRAVRIIGEVAKALDYAHRRNVVHRDVKPANFLLTGQGGAGEQVLLGDFGIARGLEDIGLTTTGSVLATMAYAAPELLAGGLFDGRADVYSLGCSLFRLLTGATPYPSGNGPAAVMMAHLHQPPPRVTARRPDLPPALDAVIATAMAKDPAQRFATAGDLVDAAQTALREVAPSVARTALPANAVGVPHVSDGGWWQPPGATPADTAPPAAPRRRRGSWIATALAVVTAVAATVAAIALTGRPEQPAAAPTPTTPSAPATPSTPAPIPAAELPELLPSAQLLSVPLTTTRLAVESNSTVLLDSSAEVTDPQCVSAWAPAEFAAYKDTGYQAVQVQTLRDDADPPQRTTLTQALIAFPTPAAAENAVSTQFSQWEQCGGRAITVTLPGGTPMQVGLGAPTGSSGTTHFLDQQRASGPQHCQRAMSASNNVVADTVVCSPTVPAPGRAVAATIAGNLPVR